MWFQYQRFILYQTLCSELNDTVVEAQQRIKQAPPTLPVEEAIERYLQSSNRLLILASKYKQSNCYDN